MNLENLIQNGSFCILPFVHQEKKFNGTFHICCYGDQLQSDEPAADSQQSFNSEKMRSIRKDLLSGSRPDACSSCYKLEDSGVTSPRIRENSTWLNWKDTHAAIDDCLDDYANDRVMNPISLDLRYSNTCTLKCRMCNSSSSSAINAEYKKLKNTWPTKFWTIDNHRINHDVRFHKNIQKIYLAGGEPMVEPLNLNILEQAADYNSEISILINTSLNIVNDKFFEVLNKFKHLTLVVSIDGTDQVNDYIRHGSNFAIVKKNIDLLSHHDIMFSTCVSMYNIFNIKNLVGFVKDQFPKFSHNHSINTVNDIEELFIENLPDELRASAIDDLNQSLEIANDFTAIGIKNCISILQQKNFDAKKFDNFIKYTKILDKHRNESIKHVVPQLAPYFDE